MMETACPQAVGDLRREGAPAPTLTHPASSAKHPRPKRGYIKESKKADYFIDPWYGRWLKVGESGSEWLNSPPAYGYVCASPNFLRR